LTRYGLYLLALVVLAADQTTKHWVIQAHDTWPNGSQPIIPGFFSLTWVNNTGGAFGIFDSVRLGTAALALASVLAAAAIVVYSLRVRQMPAILGVALGLALGGAVGNLADRVRLHYVVDFLDFHIGSHQWPVFNVADSAICIGVALLMIFYGRTTAKTPQTASTED
jgi:signal peptidase II